MFPKFLVVFTKHTDATPTTTEQNIIIESRPADTPEVAQQLINERLAYHRSQYVPGQQFGPGTITVQAAIFIQQPTVQP